MAVRMDVEGTASEARWQLDSRWWNPRTTNDEPRIANGEARLLSWPGDHYNARDGADGFSQGKGWAVRLIALCVFVAFAGAAQTPAGPRTYRTLDDRFEPPHYTSADAWNTRAAY